MKTSSIEDLVYVMKQAKDKGEPSPIFFLGAGASKTAGIPLASEIVEDILNDYSDNPKIKALPNDDKTYTKLMDALTPYERNDLLKGYIASAKINVTHIYLAQLIKKGFADYVLTVNFDNLMLRALSLFNEFPSTYDMAILKDLTTTTFKEKSVVYLHGQHHGLWLLNTEEEMKKVKNVIPPILHSIKDRRPWVFIGYSGNDPIFEHIVNLGRFDNGLYWVAHDDGPRNRVRTQLLDKPNTNSSIIKGHDSDSFMLKLNLMLGLPQPEIIDKPFSSLREMLKNINDIDEKEHFKGAKERLEIAKQQVDESILRFEEGKLDLSKKNQNKSVLDLLKKELTNLIIQNKYNKHQIEEIEDKVKKLNNKETNILLANLYFNWGLTIGNSAEMKPDEAEELYQQAIDKYVKTTEINPNDDAAFYNWGVELSNLAQLKPDEAEELYQQAIEKYTKTVELNPNDDAAFYNWGVALGNLAQLKPDEAEELYQQAIDKSAKTTEISPDNDSAFDSWGLSLCHLAQLKPDEAEELYQQAIDKYAKATEINPNNDSAFYNWGLTLGNLAKLKPDEAEELYQQAIEKYTKTVELNPNDDAAFHNWAIELGNLAQLKPDKAENLYQQAIDKYTKTVEINPNNDSVFESWGIALANLAQLKPDKAENLYQQAIEKNIKAVELGSSPYNLACLYAIKNEKENALKHLETCLSDKKIEVEFIKKDNDWKEYLDNKDFTQLLEKYDNK